MISCKICNKEAKSRAGLHTHLKRTHKIPLKQYYEIHEPRKNLLTGANIKFDPKKGYKEYCKKDFANKSQLNKWCEITPENLVRPYILSLLKNYANKRKITTAPCCIDFETSKTLPAMSHYVRIIGYEESARACGLSLPFDYSEEAANLIIKPLPMFVDTREKYPFKFYDGTDLITHKLDVGDYCLSGDNFNKIFIERKSESDFKSTMSNQIERFEKEIIRCRDMGCYMFVVVERKISRILSDNFFGGFSYNLDWVFHNTKKLQRKYKDCCQFVFAENKKGAARATQALLQNGPAIKNQDINFYYSF